MNQVLSDAVESLAKKAAESSMAHDAINFANAANNIAQAAAQLHYMEHPPVAPTTGGNE